MVGTDLCHARKRRHQKVAERGVFSITEGVTLAGGVFPTVAVSRSVGM
jgi:hypothetical protein